jgi:hypothetical protein
MSSLICANAATDSDSSSMWMIIPIPVLMSNIHFRFFLILLVTFEASSHKWGWYYSNKVYHPKLHHLGKQFNKFVAFGLASCSPVVRALVYQPCGPGFDSWHVSFRVSYYRGGNPNDAAATYLIFVNYILFWLGLGLVMMGLVFLSSFLDKGT